MAVRTKKVDGQKSVAGHLAHWMTIVEAATSSPVKVEF